MSVAEQAPAGHCGAAGVATPGINVVGMTMPLQFVVRFKLHVGGGEMLILVKAVRPLVA